METRQVILQLRTAKGLSQEVLAAELRKHPVSQALILVKGSHSIGLERLADLL